MFNMIKSWNIFKENTSVDMWGKSNIKLENIRKYAYTEEDFNLVEDIRKRVEDIKKEYGFRLNFNRFDVNGLPFIDIDEIIDNKSDNFFATYQIKDRRFSMWLVKKLEETHDVCVLGSDYTWPDLASILPNMTFDNYYLHIKGDFF